VNVREETEAESAASSDASTARTIAIVAFALLIAVALARAVYVTRLVRRVASQNEELRQLDAVKDELIATVSHEFRTPLTSVQGYLELLEDEADELNEEHLKYIAIARRSSERLLRLVNDLLLLAEIDDRRFSLDKTSVELSALIRRAVDSARPVAAGKHLSLDVAAADDVPPVDADGSRLAQVVDNLIGNAIKFTEDGGVHVSLERDDDAAVIRVADTGIGITPEDAAQLFERFYRARAAREGAIAGTGLGLAIAKAIVDEHGGEIAAAPNERGGTTFSVRLPFAAEL
jgi:signal transduction histidine kinase